MEELRAESLAELGGSGSIGRSKGASIASNHQQISVAVVTELVRWNEEAVSRCNIFSSQVIFISSSGLFLPFDGCAPPNFQFKIHECFSCTHPQSLVCILWVSFAVFLFNVE